MERAHDQVTMTAPLFQVFSKASSQIYRIIIESCHTHLAVVYKYAKHTHKDWTNIESCHTHLEIVFKYATNTHKYIEYT